MTQVKPKTIIAGIILGAIAYLVAKNLLKPKAYVKVGTGTSSADGQQNYGNGIGFADANGMDESMDNSSGIDGGYGNGVGFADANGVEDEINSSADGQQDYGNGVSFEDANGVDSVDGSYYTPDGDFYSADGDFHDADDDYFGADGDFYSGADGTYYGAEGMDEKSGKATAEAVIAKNKILSKHRSLHSKTNTRHNHGVRPNISKELAWWKKRVELLHKSYTILEKNEKDARKELPRIYQKIKEANVKIASLKAKMNH